MPEEPDLSFPPFRLELANERLWRGTEPLSLRPKAFRLLRYLAEHPKRLLTREELRKALWQHDYVSDGLLRGYIRMLREVLGDDTENPRLIETAGGRGYRFIAPLTSTRPVPSFIGSPALQSPSPFVGRQEELAHLHDTLKQALRGERQVVLVTGEPGIGKTALIDTFLSHSAGAHHPGLWIGRGQCIEHHGTGEAYLLLLEALGGLARGAEGRALVPLLRRQAPTWLVQMPALMEDAEREALSRQLHGSTQERMARELAEVLEVLTAESPLVLWLEDLHWSDLSTVDLLAMLARRREPARLLVVGTYRLADVITSGHPLRGLVRELNAHAQCVELPLRFLTASEITQYLAARFARPESQAVGLEAWGRFVHRHTDGNPLFIVTLVDDLMGQGVIGDAALDHPWPAPPASLAGGLPGSLRQLIEHQLERLSEEEQRVLEAASVAGMEFSTAVVAAALETDVLKVEGCCNDLAHRHLFLCSTKESPEGPTGPNRRLSECYRFLHALYPQTVCEGWPVARRRQLHRQVGLSKDDRLRQPPCGNRRGACRAFRGGQRHPSGGALSRAGGAEGASAIRCPGGERSSDPGARTREAARGARACPTRAVTANEPDRGTLDKPGLYGARGEAGLCARPCALRADWGEPAPLPGPGWAVSVRAHPGGTAGSAGARGAAAAARPGSARCPRGAFGLRGDSISSGGARRWPALTWNRAPGPTIATSKRH